MVPDREEDIRPRFHKNRRGGPPGAGEGEDEEDMEEDGGVGDWNLSKSFVVLNAAIILYGMTQSYIEYIQHIMHDFCRKVQCSSFRRSR